MTAMTITCSYSHDYYDFQNNKRQPFVCKEESLSSGFCKYHDEEYFREHESEIHDSMLKKIEESIDYKIPLICVGYFLPALTIDGKKFSTSVSFVDAKFLGEMIFDNCVFSDIDFSDSIFDTDVSFVMPFLKEK